MTETPLTDDDTVLPFQLDRANVRGRVARLDATLDAILRQHAYPDVVSALVAEAALLTALIGQTMKLRWRLSLQVRGEGAVRLIATDYFAAERSGGVATLRAYASFDPDLAPSAAPFSLLGKGHFGMTIDQGPGTTPYQGITPLAGGSLTACAETYFAQSEQLATRFEVSAARSATPGGAEQWRGGAVMLQHLPEASPHAVPDQPSSDEGLLSPEDVAAMSDGGDDWRRANMLLDTVELHELVGPVVGTEGLLLRLFHEEAPRIWPAQGVRFGCTCSADRVEAALAQYSARDIATMTTEAGKVTADCQFCGAHYSFDPATLGFEAGSSNHS